MQCCYIVLVYRVRAEPISWTAAVALDYSHGSKVTTKKIIIIQRAHAVLRSTCSVVFLRMEILAVNRSSLWDDSSNTQALQHWCHLFNRVDVSLRHSLRAGTPLESYRKNMPVSATNTLFFCSWGLRVAGSRRAGGLPAIPKVRLHQGYLRHVLPVHGGGHHPRLHNEGVECVKKLSTQRFLGTK